MTNVSRGRIGRRITSGHAYVLDRPIGSDECDEVGEFRNSQPKVALGADLPLVCEICAVLSYDREARSIADVEPSGAYNGVYLAFDAVFTYNAVLGDFVDGREMDVHVWLLDCRHVRVTRRDSPAANAPRGRKAVEETLILDELSHPSFHRLLANGLCLGVLVEGAPEAVDLIFDALGMLDQLGGVLVKGRFLLVRVLVVGAVVVGYLHKPHSSSNEYVEMLGVRLHVRDCLNRRSSGANHSDTIVLPLVCLIFLRPSSRVYDLRRSAKLEVATFVRISDLSLEFLHTLDLRPLEVVENTCAMEEQIASILKQPCTTIRLRFLELDQPFALVLFPVATDDFGLEGHVFPQAPNIADFVQVFPDVWRVRKEAGPVGLSCSQREHWERTRLAGPTFKAKG